MPAYVMNQSLLWAMIGIICNVFLYIILQTGKHMKRTWLNCYNLDNFALFQHLGDTLTWIQTMLVTYLVT